MKKTSEEILDLAEEIHSNKEDFIDGDLTGRIEVFPSYELKEVLILDIDLSEWNVSESIVTDYMAQPIDTQPPAILQEFDGQFSIIDGTHRLNALHNLGIKKVLAYVGDN